jgi:hypothetical protein
MMSNTEEIMARARPHMEHIRSALTTLRDHDHTLSAEEYSQLLDSKNALETMLREEEMQPQLRATFESMLESLRQMISDPNIEVEP